MPQRKKTSITQRRGAQVAQWEAPRQPEHHLAPPKQAERRRARPGAGIKKSKAAMAAKKKRS